MIIIDKKQDGGTLLVRMAGRLDRLTAPQFEKEVRDCLDGITELVIDLNEVEYVSSAGLRALFSAQKIMSTQGTMVVKNLQEAVREVFEITGFTDILTIE